MKPNRQTRVLIPAGIVLLLLTVSGGVALSQSGAGSSFGYNQFYQWFQFTDNTGTWHAPVAMHNGSAPSDSITEFTVNTDNQFQIQNYNLGRLASFLDLDTDGSAALYGAQGGGVGADAATGDTCIPAILTAPCGPNSMRIGTTGIVSQYRGQATAGDGISAILYWTDTSLTGSFGPYTIFTTNGSGYASSGMYRLSGYIVETTNAPNATMNFSVQYTDETGAQTQDTGPAIPFGTVGSRLPFQFVLNSEPGKTISYTVTTSNAASYGFHLRLEAM
jgi:hypothetical protein